MLKFACNYGDRIIYQTNQGHRECKGELSSYEQYEYAGKTGMTQDSPGNSNVVTPVCAHFTTLFLTGDLENYFLC